MSGKMGTQKPRVCGYITNELDQRVSWLMQQDDCTQSRIVEECIKALCGLDDSELLKLLAIAKKNKRSYGDEASILLSEKLSKIKLE